MFFADFDAVNIPKFEDIVLGWRFVLQEHMLNW
jgi:hypothetical protein